MRSPRDAIAAGIGMVHQHFQLIPVLTVTENIVLGLGAAPGADDRPRAPPNARWRELSERFGLQVDPRARVEGISVAQQQRVEILKALYRRADILILDEPTAVLSPQEALELMAVLRGLAADGKGIIFISHKLNEVLELADRISVLRLGRKVGTVAREGATGAALAQMMVGREVDLSGRRQPGGPAGLAVLRAEGLVVRDDRGLEAVRGLDLEVREGEIVAIAGVDGNGQSELIEALTGLRRPAAGRVIVGGKDVTGSSPKRIGEAGLGLIPEDRHRFGLVLEFDLAENLVLGEHYRPPVSRFGWMRPRWIAAHAKRLLERFDVRGGGPHTAAGSLSGGNQQKAVLAREIDREPAALIAAQPTRGLDVGGHRVRARAACASSATPGRGVLLVSFELDEIMALADRIVVMYEGRIVLERRGGDCTREELGVAMTGGLAEAEAVGTP